MGEDDRTTRERERDLAELRAQTDELAGHAIRLARVVEQLCEQQGLVIAPAPKRHRHLRIVTGTPPPRTLPTLKGDPIARTPTAR